MGGACSKKGAQAPDQPVKFDSVQQLKEGAKTMETRPATANAVEGVGHGGPAPDPATNPQEMEKPPTATPPAEGSLAKQLKEAASGSPKGATPAPPPTEENSMGSTINPAATTGGAPPPGPQKSWHDMVDTVASRQEKAELQKQGSSKIEGLVKKFDK